MPDTKGKRRPLVRTQRAKTVRPGAPCLETRARSILATMVTEMAAEPGDLRMPQVPPPIVTRDASADDGPSLDDLPASALEEIARQGASLELDGAKHEASDLVSLAESVTDDAHLKINNSGTFTAEELALIARSSTGQVILA